MLKKLIHGISHSVGRYSNIPTDWMNYMLLPKTEVTVRFPVELRNELKTITGVRIIHSNHILPTKGGLRLSASTPMEDLEQLAVIMTFKASLLDIPFGGAKGCIFIDPNQYTYEEKVRIVRRFTVELWKRSMMGASTDVMNPDVGSDEKMMNIIKETYKNLVHNEVNIDAVVTGKGKEFGGMGVSNIAATHGIGRIANFIEENINKNKILARTGLSYGGSKKSVIIQGYGEDGYHYAKYLAKGNFKIIGMTDGTTGCYNPIGFDPDEIYDYKMKNHGLEGISKNISNPAEVLSQKCDILISCNKLSLDKSIADNLKAKIIIEGCNAPCTLDALDILNQKGVVVIPEILSFSGRFIVSYLEWLKNLEHRNLTLLFKRFEKNSRNILVKMLSTSEFGIAKDTYQGPTEEELVLKTIEEIIDSSFHSVLQEAEQFKMDLKTAAYKIAIERIYKNHKNPHQITF